MEQSSPKARPRWFVLLAGAALALLAMELGPDFLPGTSPRELNSATLVGLPQNFSEALQRTDARLGPARERARQRDSEWLMSDVSARAYLARARLTGSYEDYAGAAAALRHGFAVAAPRTGPHQSAAVLAFSMHRLAEAERNLDEIARYAVPPDRGEQAEFVAMRGDIALYRGQYGQALEAYDIADRLVPGTSDFRRAVYHSKTGRPDLADAFYVRTERALAQPTRQTLGNLELQRGILDLDRRRLDDALVHFRRAAEIFPGYWLIDEHIAEVTARRGDLPAADRLYRDIVARTGSPEFMDARADIAQRRGDARAAAYWVARADAGWARRLQLFPEASYGHAIDHCIVKHDWTCALALARRNHDARPYGDAKIALSRALLGSGQLGAARETIETVLASPWRTAELHDVAAQIYIRGGQVEAAARQRKLERQLQTS